MKRIISVIMSCLVSVYIWLCQIISMFSRAVLFCFQSLNFACPLLLVVCQLACHLKTCHTACIQFSFLLSHSYEFLVFFSETKISPFTSISQMKRYSPAHWAFLHLPSVPSAIWVHSPGLSSSLSHHIGLCGCTTPFWSESCSHTHTVVFLK